MGALEEKLAALTAEVQRLRSLFEHSPICLWEEDLSGIKAYFDELRAQGVTDMRAYFEAHPEAIGACLSRVKVLDVNEAALKLYEAGSKAELFEGLGRILTPDSLVVMTQQLIALAEGRSMFEGESSDQSFTGRKNHVLVKSLIAPGCESTLSRVYVSIVDLTARRQLEERLIQAQKMDAVGQLAGGVAHDFNNLLTIIHCSTAVMQSAVATAAQRDEALKEVIDATERASGLTRQLLTVSRRSLAQPQQVSLNDIVEGLSKMLRSLVGESIDLRLKLTRRPLVTRADAGMLDQVLMNLVVNARDALPKGGRVVIETAEVLLGSHEAYQFQGATPGVYICLRVSDDGIGIAPPDLAHIFEPFFTTKERGKGTGLGLSTVFGIVKQHGGAISVSSELGVGTTFTILLPASVERGAAAARPPLPVEPRGGAESILVVEDEDRVRDLVQRLLKMQGYRVEVAGNGVEALAVLEQRGGDFDLVITDVIMPGGVSGRDLAARIRKERPKLRVICMSGYTGELSRDDIESIGGTTFLQKPFGRAALLEIVRACLDAGDATPIPSPERR